MIYRKDHLTATYNIFDPISQHLYYQKHACLLIYIHKILNIVIINL